MKLRTLLFNISASLVLLLASCAKPNAEVEYLPCMTDSTQYALINSKGEIISPDFHGRNLSAVVNGFLTASTSDGVSVYRLTKDGPVAVDGLSGLLSAGYMSCGVMPVCRAGHHIELVNGDGETVATLEIESGEITECWPSFVDGVLAVTTDSGLTGLVGTDGHLIVEPKYIHIGPVSDGMMIAMTETQSESANSQSYSVIDTKGQVLYSFPSGIVPVSEIISAGRVAVRTVDGFALSDVNTGGTLTELPSQVVRIIEVGDGHVVVRNSNGRIGVLDMEGNEILAPDFRSVRIGIGGELAALSDTGWSLYDRDGREICKMSGFQMLVPTPEQSYKAGFAFVGRAMDGYYLVDSAGNKVNASPLYRIDATRIEFGNVATDYATATAPVELPESEEEPD